MTMSKSSLDETTRVISDTDASMKPLGHIASRRRSYWLQTTANTSSTEIHYMQKSFVQVELSDRKDREPPLPYHSLRMHVVSEQGERHQF